MSNSWKIILSALPLIAFSSPSLSHASCPKITTSDLEQMSQHKKIIAEVPTFIEAADANAAQNMASAVKGMEQDKVFTPKEHGPMKHALGEVCVYEVNSNQIKEVWTKVTPLAFPNNPTKDQVKQLLQGKNVFTGFRYEAGSLTLEKLEAIPNDKFKAVGSVFPVSGYPRKFEARYTAGEHSRELKENVEHSTFNQSGDFKLITTGQ